MFGKNDWKMMNKVIHVWPQFLICLSLLSNVMVLSNDHNDLNDSLNTLPQNQTHRKGRCKLSRLHL